MAAGTSQQHNKTVLGLCGQPGKVLLQPEVQPIHAQFLRALQCTLALIIRHLQLVCTPRLPAKMHKSTSRTDKLSMSSATTGLRVCLRPGWLLQCLLQHCC